MNKTRLKITLRNFLIHSTSGVSLFSFDDPIPTSDLYLTQYIQKKKRYIRTSICAFLMSLTFHTPTFAKPPSYYRFTSYIYEQDEKINHLKRINSEISVQTIDDALLEELHKRKEKELEKNCLEKIQIDLEELGKQLVHVKDIELKNKILSGIATAVTDVSSGITVLAGALGPGAVVGAFAVGAAASMVAKIAEDLISSRYLHKTALDNTPIETIVQEMRDLEKKYKELKDGLKSEPIEDLERRYVIQKRHMNNSGLQEEIERSLIQSRVADYYFQLNTPSIGYALGLPLGPKPLIDINNDYKSQEELIKRFDEERAFSIYTKDIKSNIFDLISRTAVNSITEPSSNAPLRVVEHWLGNGSTGKSTAAKAVARFLGLPYFEKRITNPDTEVNIQNLSGALRSFQGSPLLGWLAEALLQKIDGCEKQTYQNAFLILDDFPVNNQNAQNLLLAVTDPEKRYFPNEYLQANLDISRLNILIISNEDFKSLKPEKGVKSPPQQLPESTLSHLVKYGYGLFGYTTEKVQQDPQSAGAEDPTLTALRSRFKTVIFPEFTEEQKGILAKPYLEETLIKQYKLPFFYNVSYVDPTKIKVTYDPEVLEDMGLEPRDCCFISTGVDEDKRSSITVRELKEILTRTISSYRTQLIKSSSDASLQDKELKALNGDPGAITTLVKEKRKDCNDISQKQQLMRRLGKGHEKSGNIDDAKKCWIDSFALMDWEVWPQVSKHLPKKIESELDQLLLEALLKFLQYQAGVHQFSEEIGNHLYQIWLQSTKNAAKNDCLKYSAVLGNQEAFEEMLKIYLFPRFKAQDIVEETQERTGIDSGAQHRAPALRLHQSILRGLLETPTKKAIEFDPDALKDSNDIYRAIINSTTTTDHFNLLNSFLNVPEFFKLFSVYRNENRQEKMNNFTTNFLRRLEAFDNQSYKASHLLSKPCKINKDNLEEDLEKLKSEYSEFEKNLSI